MSNPQNPGVAQGLAKVLQKATQGQGQKPTPAPQFALPDTQTVKSGAMEWMWNVPPAEGDGIAYKIQGSLNVQTGEYRVEMAGSSPDLLEFLGDEAKNVGIALISAHGYKDVWKDHAGYFMEKEMMGE